MARILNLIVVVFELIAFVKVHKSRDLRKSMVFYTQLSNMLALISSLLLVIFGQKAFVEVMRYLSVSMLVMTFIVTAFILVPMSGKLKELMFTGSGLYHHLLVPVLSTVSYLFAEDRVKPTWIWLPVAATLIYGFTMLYLNAIKKVDGPYPFFRIKKLGAKKTVLWMCALALVIGAVSFAVGYRRTAGTDTKYVFVHGLSGWGSYDTINELYRFYKGGIPDR